MPQFAHQLEWVKSKGKTKVRYVPCGKTSGWLASREEGIAWALKHSKLREAKRYQRLLDSEKLAQAEKDWESRL